jgi:hypothetical protein
MINFEIKNPEISSIEKINKCYPGFKNDENSCLTIGYTIIGKREAWIDYAMDYVGEKNGLVLGKDIK